MNRMYFIEILTKFFEQRKLNKLKSSKTQQVEEDTEETECEHMFVPIDSTGKIFACVNCGLVLDKKPKNLNFFEGEK